MKNSTTSYMVQMARIFLLGGLFTFFITNCSQEPLSEGDLIEPELKASRMLPKYHKGEVLHYEGMINNDSIEILIPENWNKKFIVYAHGYVDPIDPIALPQDVIANVPLKQFIVGANYGYASTSYSENGFAVKEAVNDVKFLGHMLKAHYKPCKIFLGGVSEGGLVALKTLEKYRNVFDAGLVVCGPVGNFNKQLQYFGDFHVLFNYFYEEELDGLDLGSPAYVSPLLMQAWSDGDLEEPLLDVIAINPWKLPVLLNVANVPVVGVDPSDYTLLAKDILRFNIMATNDMIERVHGIPFDNTERIYSGTLLLPPDSILLNNYVMRIAGDKQAMHRVKQLYESSGSPNVPTVFMHTQGDHITPYWHIGAFIDKTDLSRTDLVYQAYPVPWHCNFTLEQVQLGMATMELLTHP